MNVPIATPGTGPREATRARLAHHFRHAWQQPVSVVFFHPQRIQLQGYSGRSTWSALSWQQKTLQVLRAPFHFLGTITGMTFEEIDFVAPGQGKTPTIKPGTVRIFGTTEPQTNNLINALRHQPRQGWLILSPDRAAWIPGTTPPPLLHPTWECNKTTITLTPNNHHEVHLSLTNVGINLYLQPTEFTTALHNNPGHRDG